MKQTLPSKFKTSEASCDPERRHHNEFFVADLLGVSVATLRRWRLAGDGPAFRKFGGAVRYGDRDIDAFVAASPKGGRSEGR